MGSIWQMDRNHWDQKGLEGNFVSLQEVLELFQKRDLVTA